MNMEYSCGAIVFSRASGRLLYVIVQEMEGAWSFPKGHMEAGETEEETAYREVYEETGLRPAFIPGFLERDEYDLAEKPGFRKRVTYFLADAGNASPAPQPEEIRQILSLPYEEALGLFEHAGTRRILEAANRFLQEL